MSDFAELFAVLPDPRAANARHRLTDVLVAAFAASLCGAQACSDMALFARAKLEVLRRLVPLRHGPPSHDTFSRVFRLLDPEAFEAVFRRFALGFAERLSELRGLDGTVVALDGKSLACAAEAGARSTPIHLVTAWAAEQRLVLAVRRAPGRSETRAALDLVETLDLLGAVVTADALHGTRAMSRAIRARGGHYALAIKGNRGPLHRAMRELLADPDPAQAATTTETAHGRYEERRAWAVAAPADWAERFGFADLAAVVRVDALRRLATSEERQSRFYALSRPTEPDQALRIIRAHWTIENGQHWALDVLMDEDRSRARKDNAAENLARLRRLVLNLLRTDPEKTSLRGKMKKAGWQDNYLLTLISQMR